MNAEDMGGERLVSMLGWLADSPLFIDRQQVERFYDAVVKPEGQKGTTTIEFSSETTDQITTTLGGEVEVGVPALLGNLFAFLPKVTGKLEKEEGEEKKKGESRTVELHAISNPQRQLEHLTLHYLASHRHRLWLVDDPSSPGWREPGLIRRVPRLLVFLDLPGESEEGGTGTKLIPTAAEFEGGAIVLLYDKLVERLREKAESEPLPYPDRAPEGKTLRQARKEYWAWFNDHFSSTQAMLVVEEAAKEHGRIQWIDYRLPLGREGDTLHLHVAPSGEYHTGTFAYNLIKRGAKHGIRLVGTLKSEPDMNVLAIYDE